MSEGRAHEVYELKQEDLHKFWPFVLRGLADIKRTLKPHWVPEDIYSALRTNAVACIIPKRSERLLGFLIYNKQLRPWSFEPECFIWCAWTLPIREWQEGDDMPGVVMACWNHVANVARTQYGTNEISWITRPGRAKAFQKKFGWRPSWVTMSAKV